MAQSTEQSVLSEAAFAGPAQMVFDGETQTSDGGMPLWIEADHAPGLTEALAAEIVDDRQSGKIDHELEELEHVSVTRTDAPWGVGEDQYDYPAASDGPP